MTPEIIAKLGMLSFNEGCGTLTPGEKAELDLVSKVDWELSPAASAYLNAFMLQAYRLGELVARGEA